MAMDSPSTRRGVPPPPIVCISAVSGASTVCLLSLLSLFSSLSFHEPRRLSAERVVLHFLPPPSATPSGNFLEYLFFFQLPAAPKSSPMMASPRFQWREPPGSADDFRHERTSSSSSDSGVALQFSPLIGGPIGQSPTLSAFSPPGLSPLTIHDSAFSTPTSTASRFTFDHVPFSSRSSEKSSLGSAFDVPTTSKETLRDVLAAVRNEGNTHQPLQRKQSVIQSTRLAVSGVLSDPQPQMGRLTVAVGEHSLEQFTKGLLGSLYQPSSHSLLSPSLSSDSVLPSPLHVSPHSEVSLSKSPASAASSEALDDDDKKQYYCQICRKDFKRPDILSRHLRRHTGEKPFGCDACGRYFSRSDHLRTHRRTHTDEKPYHCDMCPYAARRRDVLTRHMNTRHQTKASPSIFQKHREIRRCLSDGDALLSSPATLPSPTTTPKRVRHSTDISPQPHSRERTLTEIPRMRGTLESEEFPSLAEIEDDVIVDIEDGDEEDEEDI